MNGVGKISTLRWTVVRGKNFWFKASEDFAEDWGGSAYFEEHKIFQDNELCFDGPIMTYNYVGSIKTVNNPVYVLDEDINWAGGFTHFNARIKNTNFAAMLDDYSPPEKEPELVESTVARDPRITKAQLRDWLNEEALIDDEEVYLSDDESFY